MFRGGSAASKNQYSVSAGRVYIVACVVRGDYIRWHLKPVTGMTVHS